MSAGNPAMHAWVGLGANLGRPAESLRRAAAALGTLPETRVLALSRLYRTPAWGRLDQPDFVNAAALLQTRLAPQQLLEALLRIEREAGRERDADARWGPRVLDLDLLLYEGMKSESFLLTLPHPRIHERAFVMVPLLDLFPSGRAPGLFFLPALHEIGTDGVERINEEITLPE